MKKDVKEESQKALDMVLFTLKVCLKWLANQPVATESDREML